MKLHANAALSWTGRRRLCAPVRAPVAWNCAPADSAKRGLDFRHGGTRIGARSFRREFVWFVSGGLAFLRRR